MGGTGGVRDTTRTRPRESPDQDSWVLTGIREPKGSDLGTLHMGYGYEAWYSCEIPNSGSGGRAYSYSPCWLALSSLDMMVCV